MAILGQRSHLVSGTTSEAQFQASIGALYDVVAQNLMNSGPETVNIVDGLATPLAKTYLFIDTENNTTSDNLDRIAATNFGDGSIILLRIVSTSRKVTIRHNQAGSGTIFLRGATSAILDNTDMTIILRYNDAQTRWEELFRNFGLYLPTTALKSSARTELGLGSAALVNTGTAANAVPLNSDLAALAKKSTIDNGNLINNGIIGLNHLMNGTAGKLIGYSPDGTPTEMDAPVPSLVLRREIFTYARSSTYNYNWVVPTVGLDEDGYLTVTVTAIGAGGGGGAVRYAGNGWTYNGSSGSATNFSTSTTPEKWVSANGGGGGTSAILNNPADTPPTTTGVGDIVTGGSSKYGGAGGPRRSSNGYTSGQGGSGAVATSTLKLLGGESIAIALGVGGSGGQTQSYGSDGIAGSPGAVLIEWYELTY